MAIVCETMGGDMRQTKATHRAAAASLDGHFRFVVRVGAQIHVVRLYQLAGARSVRIEAAFFCGKRIPDYQSTF